MFFPNIIYSQKKTGDKEIALTFDDGPDPVFTPELLELLGNHNLKATFFLSGKSIEKNPHIVSEIVSQDHEIGNHSYNHDTLSFKSWKQIRNEIEKTDMLLIELGLPETTLFRPPYGRYSLSLLSVLKDMKKKMILWNIGSKDYKADNPQQILKRIKRKLKPGSVIVLHDKTGKIMLSALEKLIPELLDQGYNFKTVSDLFDLSSSISENDRK